jgi:hypothetical protein
MEPQVAVGARLASVAAPRSFMTSHCIKNNIAHAYFSYLPHKRQVSWDHYGRGLRLVFDSTERIVSTPSPSGKPSNVAIISDREKVVSSALNNFASLHRILLRQVLGKNLKIQLRRSFGEYFWIVTTSTWWDSKAQTGRASFLPALSNA